MHIVPSFDTVSRLARPGVRIPVWCEFLFDCDTAVSAYFKLKDGPFGFLLESAQGGEQWARNSFLGSRPREVWKLDGEAVSVWTEDRGWELRPSEDPVADLHGRLTRFAPVPDDRLPRFWGGAVGYLGYDLVRRFEHLPNRPPDDLGLPTAVLMFPEVVLAVDNFLGRAKAIATIEVGDEASIAALRERYAEAAERLLRVARRLRSTPGPEPLDLVAEADTDPRSSSNVTREEFEDSVRRIKEYITEGDAFQVVLSQRLSTDFSKAPLDLYRALRSLNPSPYMVHLDLGEFQIVGSSPEVLVRLEDDVVTVRPIAGTRPRGNTPEEDVTLAEGLLADEKELAEHRMLVDLGRNDVGRVAEYGSVRVPELMQVERFSHVMHLCSRVEGTVRPGLSALDVLAAGFPAGTVSGAPKVRAMEIIDELEPTARGPYAGAVGHFAWGGRTMDTCIAIRTMVIKDGRAHVQAGAGIVADSVPAHEYQETLNKARALLRASAMVPE